jgi:hypothetical protein
MEAKQLAQLIRKRIAEQGTMSLTAIRERAQSKGISDSDTLAAMSVIHRLKDITVTVRDNDNWYSIKQAPKPHKQVDTYHPTPELKAIMDAEVKDFWEHSPLLSDTERECYYLRMTDRKRYKTCECPTCVEWRYMLSNREERAMAEVVRQREVIKGI